MIVVIEQNQNNKIELTKKELENLLKQAENEGYTRGFKDGSLNLYNAPININDKITWKCPDVTCNTEYTGDVVNTTSTGTQIKGILNEISN